MDDQKRGRQQAALARLDRFSRFTDSSIRIPFTRFELGAEALIGLVPVIGDAAGLVLSSYVLVEAQRAGVSGATKRRMLRNMMVDFVGGLVPVVGDAFDAIFKANTRLVRQDLLKQLGAEPARRFPWGTLVGLSILFGVITAAGVALLA